MSSLGPIRRTLSDGRWDGIARSAVWLGLLLRAVWILWLHPPFDHLYSDMGGYVDRALRVATGAAPVPYDAFYPPGTHLILAVPLAVFGADRSGLWAGAVLWTALSAFTPYAMWRFARYHLTVPAAALTAVFVSLWPLLISYAGYFTSETPALAFLIGALWLAERAGRSRSARGLVASGVLAGLAAANRPALALNAAVSAFTVQSRTRLRAIAAIAGGGVLVLALVTAYDTNATGSLTFVSQNGGITFYLGHCDVRRVTAGSALGRTYTFLTPPTQQRGTGHDVSFPDRAVWDQSFFYAQGLACIRSDGLSHLRVLARDVLDMTLTSSLWPQVSEPALARVIDLVNVLFSVALPFILVGAVVLVRHRRRRGEPAGEAVMLAHFATVLATALLFFGDPRFRVPYDVFALALLASLIAHRLFDRPDATSGAPVRYTDVSSWHVGYPSLD